MARLDKSLTPPAQQGKWVLLPIALLIVASFFTLGGSWGDLFSRESGVQMGKLFSSFVPLETNANFLRKVAWGSVETLAISFIGTAFATVAGLILAIPAAGFNGKAARYLARLVLNVLRAIPELVWATLLVITAGLGPFPGTLALAIHTAGVLGRLMADALENSPQEPFQALRQLGASPIAAFFYGTLPVVLPQLTSYSLYRWENNIRAAAILGVVGAGGLGSLLYYHMSLLQFQETGTVLLAMIVIVGVVDLFSGWLRQRMAS